MGSIPAAAIARNPIHHQNPITKQQHMPHGAQNCPKLSAADKKTTQCKLLQFIHSGGDDTYISHKILTQASKPHKLRIMKEGLVGCEVFQPACS